MDGMGEGQKGKVVWCYDRKHGQAILFWILALTGSQCSVLSSDEDRRHPCALPPSTLSLCFIVSLSLSACPSMSVPFRLSLSLSLRLPTPCSVHIAYIWDQSSTNLQIVAAYYPAPWSELAGILGSKSPALAERDLFFSRPLTRRRGPALCGEAWWSLDAIC